MQRLSTRRGLWTGLAAAIAVAAAHPALAAPQFKHIILVIQENRTPDDLFGSNPTFEPGVDLAISGPTSTGAVVKLTPEEMDSCWDLSHTHNAFEQDLTQGFNKDFPAIPSGCTLPPHPQYTYVDNSTGEVVPYFSIAEDFSFANRMFQTHQGPSFPAHQFLFAGTSAPGVDTPLFMSENPAEGHVNSGCIAPAGQTVALIDQYGSETSNAPIYPCVDHPALSDDLEAANITWRYYTPSAGSIWSAPDAITHICGPKTEGKVTTCQGTDWKDHVVADNPAQVLTDVANCDLQGVSWVIPTKQASDHSSVTDGSGPAWVASIVNAVGQQATCPSGENYWQDTAIIITWDDWGGFYDHVPPPQLNVATPGSPPVWGDGYTYGFRVPMMIVSAYTPAAMVDNVRHDFGSILYFVEQNFGLGFIGPTDSVYDQYADYQAAQRGDNLMEFFPLNTPRAFPSIPTPLPPGYFLAQPKPTTGPDDD